MNRVVSAKALLFAEDGKVLVLRSSSTHPRRPGGIDLPGGIVEDDELTSEGVVREILEETGMTLRINDISELYASTVWIDQIQRVYVHHLFAARATTVDVSLSWEHESYEWIDFSELTGMHDNYQRGIDFIRLHKLAEQFVN